MTNDEKVVTELLRTVDIEVDGTRPWDPQVHEPKFFPRVLAQRSLGLGESYMDGWWDAERLDHLFMKLLRTDLDRKLGTSWKMLWPVLKAKLVNQQSRRRAFNVGRAHYDIGNDLFELMLDERMIYSCGYWQNVSTLAAAQEAKLEMICRKVDLQAGMRVLDVGCGWGGFARFAAEHYGVDVVGLTISAEQAREAARRCDGLPIEIRLQDYRECNEQFDRIVSVGMFEHVGPKNYRSFMGVVRRCLVDDGLFLLHTIGGKCTTAMGDAWLTRYIFPNGHLPSVAQIAEAVEHRFVIEDLHNFGADYDNTLMAWYENFTTHWPRIAAKYGERFHRMWCYYLLSCAGAFRARNIQLWQLVMSKQGVIGGYRRPSLSLSTAGARSDAAPVLR